MSDVWIFAHDDSFSFLLVVGNGILLLHEDDVVQFTNSLWTHDQVDDQDVKETVIAKLAVLVYYLDEEPVIDPCHVCLTLVFKQDEAYLDVAIAKARYKTVAIDYDTLKEICFHFIPTSFDSNFV